MIKFLSTLLLTALVVFTIGLFLPWWSVALASFLVSLIIRQRPIWSFLSGFLAVFLLWGGLSFFIDQQNRHILSDRVAVLFQLEGRSYLLILITAFIGAVVSGLASLSSAYAYGKAQ